MLFLTFKFHFISSFIVLLHSFFIIIINYRMSANRVGLDELELDEDAPSNATFSYRRFALMKWIKRVRG